MKQLIRKHAHEHLSHRGIIQIKNGHLEAHGVYGATVILTCPETIEYYHIYASGNAVAIPKPERKNAVKSIYRYFRTSLNNITENGCEIQNPAASRVREWHDL